MRLPLLGFLPSLAPWPPGAVCAQLAEGCWPRVWISAAHAPMWMNLTWKEQAFEGDAWLFVSESWPEIRMHINHGLMVDLEQ